MKGGLFYEIESHLKRRRIAQGSNEEIQHEVFFEEGLTAIKSRPLFIGSGFQTKRFTWAFVLGLSLLILLIARAGWMQIWHGTSYSSLAEANRLRSTTLWPKRGLIYDRQHLVLTENIPRFQVTLTPRDALSLNEEDWNSEMAEAARLLGMTLDDFLAYRDPITGPENVLITDGLVYERAVTFAIALPHLPGFHLDIRPRRRYPFSTDVSSLSHILGYVGKLSPEEYKMRKEDGYRVVDEIGKAGVESSYEPALRGTLGERVSEVDSEGRVKAFIREIPPKNGQDIVLSVDEAFQRATQSALQDGLKRAGVSRGAAIALDPRDGSVLALVSLPAFDDNIFSGSVSSTLYQKLVQDESQPLFPRAWAGTYPSGSTVKIVIAAAALMEGIITPHTSVVSTGGLQIGPWFFPDWKAGGHGVTDVRRALAWSVNTFFYTVGGGYESFIGLGPDRLSVWMMKFGLGKKTGLDVPGEAGGFVPTRDWKQKAKGEKWFVGDTYNLSIGQGDLLVTPIQVASYTAAIANGGRFVTPHLVEATVQATSTSFISSDVVSTVQQGMRDAVTYGSARALNDLPFAAAGKTGTAQWNNKKKNHAWFTSFAPYNQPEIVVTVLIEEGGEGSSYAVLVAKEMLKAWWRLRAERGGMF